MKLSKKIKLGLLRRIKGLLRRVPPLTVLLVFFARVIPGYRTFRKVLKSCPEEYDRLYFMDYDGSGDTYLTCSYLLSKKLIGEKDVFVAPGNLSLKIAKLFPFGHFVRISPKASLTVRAMERFLGAELGFSYLLYESEYLEYSGIMRKIAGFKGLDFMTLLKIGMECNCAVPYDDAPLQQPLFPYDPHELDEIFAANGLIPGRTALISPYAGKHDPWGVPMSFYENIASELAAKGYVVCTNSGDADKEPAIKGTIPLLVPHRLMRAFCEKAGYFVAVRSGLCDIVSAAENCKKVIVYPPTLECTGVSSFMDYFSLKNMGLCADAVEFVWGE